MQRIISKIIPIWRGRLEKSQIENFATQLSRSLEYVEIISIDTPIFVDIKRNLSRRLEYAWYMLNELCRIDFTVIDLEKVLEDEKQRFNENVIFSPSNLRLYSEEDCYALSGRCFKEYGVLWINIDDPYPTATAKHEFAHWLGLEFSHSSKHPEDDCVITVPWKMSEFCDYCKNFIENRLLYANFAPC